MSAFLRAGGDLQVRNDTAERRLGAGEFSVGKRMSTGSKAAALPKREALRPVLEARRFHQHREALDALAALAAGLADRELVAIEVLDEAGLDESIRALSSFGLPRAAD